MQRAKAVQSVGNGLPLFPRAYIGTASQFEFLGAFLDGRISGLDFSLQFGPVEFEHCGCVQVAPWDVFGQGGTPRFLVADLRVHPALKKGGNIEFVYRECATAYSELGGTFERDDSLPYLGDPETTGMQQ